MLQFCESRSQTRWVLKEPLILRYFETQFWRVKVEQYLWTLNWCVLTSPGPSWQANAKYFACKEELKNRLELGIELAKIRGFPIGVFGGDPWCTSHISASCDATRWNPALPISTWDMANPRRFNPDRAQKADCECRGSQSQQIRGPRVKWPWPLPVHWTGHDFALSPKNSKFHSFVQAKLNQQKNLYDNVCMDRSALRQLGPRDAWVTVRNLSGICKQRVWWNQTKKLTSLGCNGECIHWRVRWWWSLVIAAWCCLCHTTQ